MTAATRINADAADTSVLSELCSIVCIPEEQTTWEWKHWLFHRELDHILFWKDLGFPNVLYWLFPKWIHA